MPRIKAGINDLQTLYPDIAKEWDNTKNGNLRPDMFESVAAVSPSVWFSGFLEYAKNNEINADYINLSLGNKEEKTKNKTLASVGHGSNYK